MNTSAKKPSPARRKMTVAAVAVILSLAVMIAVIVALFFPRENTDDFRVYYDERVIAPYSKSVRDGFVYINAMQLAEYCRLTVSGSSEQLKLWADADECAVFTPGGSIATLSGVTVAMPAPAYFEDGELWIPCDFVNDCFNGVNIIIDREKNKLSVYRTEAEGSTTTKPIYVTVRFTAKPSDTTIPQNTVDDMIKAYTFTTNTDKFLPYINPQDDKYLLLVNKSHLLSDSFVPNPLTDLKKDFTIYNSSKQLESIAAIALEAMMSEMRAAGYTDVYVTSAYRNYKYQSSLFSTYINREMAADRSLSYEAAKAKVLTYSAEPGTSEHQSGLCVDLITSDMTDLDESFATKPVYKWLCENAHKFGFILRFPEDKEEITGYNYEPWHYRFVGQYAAAEIYLSGQCLEEYLGILN